MTQEAPFKLHSVADAAKLLGNVSQSYIRKLLWQRKLTHVKVGRLVRIYEHELLSLIDARGKHVD